MAVVSWFLDWVAAIVVIAVGIVWFLGWADVLGDKPEQATLVLEDPWWVTVPVCGVLVLAGALRLRMAIRRSRHGV